MRRQSYCPSSSSGNGAGEPLIVVEESTLGEEEAERCRAESPPRCVDPDSPSLNPYLLSPWRDARKHSLPTPQCTSGITASQVRVVYVHRKSFAVGDIDMRNTFALYETSEIDCSPNVRIISVIIDLGERKILRIDIKNIKVKNEIIHRQ